MRFRHHGPDELTQNSGDLEVQVEDGVHVVMDNVLVSESDSSSGLDTDFEDDSITRKPKIKNHSHIFNTLHCSTIH